MLDNGFWMLDAGYWDTGMLECWQRTDDRGQRAEGIEQRAWGIEKSAEDNGNWKLGRARGLGYWKAGSHF
jgi:hypothetical protein